MLAPPACLALGIWWVFDLALHLCTHVTHIITLARILLYAFFKTTCFIWTERQTCAWIGLFVINCTERERDFLGNTLSSSCVCLQAATTSLSCCQFWRNTWKVSSLWPFADCSIFTISPSCFSKVLAGISNHMKLYRYTPLSGVDQQGLKRFWSPAPWLGVIFIETSYTSLSVQCIHDYDISRDCSAGEEVRFCFHVVLVVPALLL